MEKIIDIHSNAEIIQKKGSGLISFLSVFFRNLDSIYKYIGVLNIRDYEIAPPYSNMVSWEYSDWKNIVASNDFVKNIIATFEKNNRLGLLIPPTPYFGNIYEQIADGWMGAFPQVKNWLDKYHINVNIKVEDEPLVPYGGSFWLRREALNCILDLNMDDNEKKIELMTLPFIAQKSGFYTGIVYNENYVSNVITNEDYMMRETNKAVFKQFGPSYHKVVVERVKEGKLKETLSRVTVVKLKAKKKIKKVLPAKIATSIKVSIMTENIGNVTLNYNFYDGTDLYSDGDFIEEHILNIVKNEDNYEYVHKDYVNWAVMYHLSRQRENIVAPMEINNTDEVLEIGAGMGAVTGALAKKAKKVDCIELSKRRSLVNAYRHKDFDNIEIIVGNFQNIKIEKKYDVITLIGVLEYAYHYIDSDKPYEDFIKKISKCLKSDGKLYIAIENKLGMKYFAGYHEDHIGKPFVGIEGYKKEDKVKTFSYSQLKNLVLENGFKKTRFFYPFPDYKLPTVIYSDDNISYAEIDFANQSNFDIDVKQYFDPLKAIQSLHGSDEVKIFANSFLVEAIKE